ncbi:MAG TPA: PadR family transcriptional regulator [Acidimicrobiales bacterium]|jgi:DNA-binding PadR family transcriptional regulator
MIDIAILGLLEDHDLHGYELRKRLGDLPGWRPTVSFGSLYPALARLERTGLVKAVTHVTSATPAAPMSGSLAGELAAFRAHRRSTTKESRGSRGKKVYGITEEGEARLHELLRAPEVVDDREFAIRLAFCHHLDRAERLALFRARRDQLLARREQQRRGSRPDSRLNTYLRSLLERDTETIAGDLAWLDRLIDAEQAAIDASDPDLGGQR